MKKKYRVLISAKGNIPTRSDWQPNATMSAWCRSHGIMTNQGQQFNYFLPL